MPDTEQKAPRANKVTTDAKEPGDSAGDKIDAAALAARHGLHHTTARPSLPTYLKSLWDKRQFVRSYSSARTAQAYSSSRLGQLWQVLTPLLQGGVYYLVFGAILGLSRGMENYPAFLITGVFVFTFLQRSMSNGAKAISGNLSMIRALHFPRAVLPLSFVLVEFQQLLISMVVLLTFVAATGEPVTWRWLLIFPAMLLQMLFNLGLGLLMARLGAESADFAQLLPFMTRVWFYISGVFYSITRFTDKMPEVWGNILSLNPGAAFLDLYRGVLMESHLHPQSDAQATPLEMPWGLDVWVVSGVWAVVMLVGGFIFFWQREERYGRG